MFKYNAFAKCTYEQVDNAIRVQQYMYKPEFMIYHGVNGVWLGKERKEGI